nr:hypothetical protein [Tanacetum cinerariifolium]
MWEAIKTRNLRDDRVKEERVETLIMEFENMKMPDNDSIDAYAAKLSGIASKSDTLGEVMSENKLVKKFLTSLPRRFVHIVVALEQVLDLKTTGFEDVVGRWKANKERVKEEDEANDAQENLLYDRTEYSNGNNDSSQGRGRGSYSRGRAHGHSQGSGCDHTQNHGQCDSSKNREDNKQKGKQCKKCDLSHIKCYHCYEYRHFVSRCPERNQNNEVKINETQEKDVYHEKCTFFMMNHIQETIFMNEEKYTPPKSESNTNEDDVWYFDNGTSNHMTAWKGRKIHHFDVKTAFLYGDRKKLDGTLQEMGFLQCVHEKAVYRKVPNGEFIILVIYKDDLFMTGASLDLINELQKRMASQFEISDLGELTYYLGIKVSQGKDCVEIKQERYAMKILKEEDEPEVEATQYRNVGCCHYLLHTHPYLTYSIGVVSRYMQSLRKSHARAIKQILRYSKGTTSFGIKYRRGNDMRLVGYSSHNVNIDDGWSTTRHIFYLAVFMATTATACQAIWLREVLAEVTGNGHVIVEHVSEGNQREDPLMTVLVHIRFKEMTLLLSVQESPSSTQKFRG